MVAGDTESVAAEKDAEIALPKGTYLPINRCNLPARILGSLTFQHQPAALQIDGVADLHHDLFQRLQGMEYPQQRAQQFSDYMDVHFQLNDPGRQGYVQGGKGRPKASWQRMIRGWFFDTDSREGAVLKSWVESRFGLLPRFHRGAIRDFSGDTYLRYLEARSLGLYNTNALEAQLDLVYSYCQYELSLKAQSHLTLYRGINNIEQLEQFKGGRIGNSPDVFLLNNLNSFSSDLERASEFGDRVVEIAVPRQKVFCFDQLFPQLLNGESEYLVIGGLHSINNWAL